MLNERLELKYEGHEKEIETFTKCLLANGYAVAQKLENGVMYIGDIFTKEEIEELRNTLCENAGGELAEEGAYIILKAED